MQKGHAAPIEFTRLGLAADSFAAQDAKSWRGPCPVCGGRRRYVIFTDNDFPLWHGWCDDCGLKVKYWESHRADKPIDPERVRARREQVEAEERRRADYRRARLAEFTTSEIYAELHERMTLDNRRWWRARGVPDSVQDYLTLGWTPDKPYLDDTGTKQHSPAATIPYFHNADGRRTFATMQYRLLTPPNPADRYRFEHGMSAAYYNTAPDLPLEPRVLVCEGAIKAIVASLIAGGISVLAVPSKSSRHWFGLPALLKNAERVYVMLDPDADRQARELATAIGPQARTASLFAKIDDAINLHGYTADDLSATLRQAH